MIIILRLRSFCGIRPYGYEIITYSGLVLEALGIMLQSCVVAQNCEFSILYNLYLSTGFRWQIPVLIADLDGPIFRNG